MRKYLETNKIIYIWGLNNNITNIFFFRIRGTLGAALILACNAGSLFAFAIPLWLGYYAQIKALMMIPIFYLIACTFFPETPEYLLKQNQKEVRSLATPFCNDFVRLLLIKDYNLRHSTFRQPKNLSISIVAWKMYEKLKWKNWTKWKKPTKKLKMIAQNYLNPIFVSKIHRFAFYQ